MITLQIEHKVLNFDDWKKVFDADPIDRRKSGVKHYTIFRPTDDPHNVIIHLGFDNISDAQEALKSLQQVWKKVEGTVMLSPRTLVLETVEDTDL